MSSRAVVVDADPGWPGRAQQVLDRVCTVLGPQVLRAEHIGSTSIPGMAAKDVLDLQLSVGSLAACDTGSWDAALGGLGLVRSPYEQDHVPAGSGDPAERWAKRLWTRRGYPGGDVNLHVRVAGSPNERLALLFRDWFRAHPATVPGYAQFKRVLAANTPDVGVYTEVKDPVVDLVIGLAEEWAATSGWSVRAY